MKIIGLCDIGGQMCAHDDGVDGWESIPHTPSPYNHCFTHCHNLHCTSLLHPAILLYTVCARKQQTVQQRVRSGWVTFIVFILTSARFTPSSNASSLHGTCLFFFYCKDEIHVNTKIMKGIRNVQLILAASTIQLLIHFN